MNSKRQDRPWVIAIFALTVLFGANILFNSWINEGNRVFYADDLTIVTSFMQADNWLEFSFMLTAQKLRPVALSLIYLVLKIAEQNYEIIDEILLLLNFMNSVLVFSFTYWLIKSEDKVKRAALALISGVLYIASHFAYYNISEVFGIMEGLGILFAIGIQFALLCYIYYDNGKKCYVFACVLYAAILYTHERYFVFFVLFIVAVLMKTGVKRKSIKLLTVPFLLMLSFWCSRILLFGNRVLDGTGGTDIKETLDIITVIKYCLSQVGYILGFQCGPRYLNGIDARGVSWSINILLCARLFFVLCILFFFVKLICTNKKFRQENIGIFVMSLLFMGLCIGSSSITIRVELRWIYVSYAMFVILLVYMIFELAKNYHPQNMIIFAFFLFIVITFITEKYYREHYSDIYYWGQKDFSRELYSETIDKYGFAIKEKDIVIVSPSPFWKEYTAERWAVFFAPYIGDNEIKVTYVGNLLQAYKECNEDSIILIEDILGRTYTDITDVFPMMQFPYADIKYGIYSDWWCEPECAFDIYGYRGNKLTLTFYYQKESTPIGSPTGKVIVNGSEETIFESPGNLTSVEIDIVPNEINSITVMFDYWVHENTGRSEDGRLSGVLILPDGF